MNVDGPMVTSAIALIGLTATWVGIAIRYRQAGAEERAIDGNNWAQVVEGMKKLMEQQRIRIDELEERDERREDEITRLRAEVARLVLRETDLMKKISALERASG